MLQRSRIGIAIPAFNEANAIGKVIADLPEWIDDVVVSDNGSTDRTAQVAEQAGALVVRENRRGYGAACLAAIAELSDAEIIIFIDGDYSDYPQDAAQLVQPILEDQADLVIGSRVLGNAEPGALTPQQAFGNWLATRLISWIWGVRFTDLGPFRAIKTSALKQLNMQDQNFGWTVEMQIKAAQIGLRCAERPVRYRKRIGHSKISGTLQGTVRAGAKILGLIAWHAGRDLFKKRTEAAMASNQGPDQHDRQSRRVIGAHQNTGK